MEIYLKKEERLIRWQTEPLNAGIQWGCKTQIQRPRNKNLKKKKKIEDVYVATININKYTMDFLKAEYRTVLNFNV